MTELKLRVVSAVILAGMALASAWWGGWVFVLVWGVLSGLILAEWLKIVWGKPGWLLWAASGIAYALALFLSMWLLRGDSYLGLVAILFLFAVVWATDILAYFAGRTFGGPKLAPRISPKKTWSGMIGGVVGGVVAGLLLLKVAGLEFRMMHAVLAAVLSLASVFGDLFESAFKRRFAVKDSGHLIPGHGGFMDRLDGFLVAAAVAALIGVMHAGFSAAASGLLEW
jgi:phosphatidate cytidylyltransferase